MASPVAALTSPARALAPQRPQARQRPRGRLLVAASGSSVQTGVVTSPSELLQKEQRSNVDLVYEYNKSEPGGRRRGGGKAP